MKNHASMLDCIKSATSVAQLNALEAQCHSPEWRFASTKTARRWVRAILTRTREICGS